jgi:gliding motility-associated-like protein
MQWGYFIANEHLKTEFQISMKRLRHVLVLMGTFLTSFIINAQNGQFDVRFFTKKWDCNAKKLTVQVQVRAHDMMHTFKMGDANYRFEYDPRQITQPRIVLQEHFSNLAPSSDLNYGPQNLNGSSEGSTRAIVSLNTFYSGTNNGAKTVDTAWTTVSSIEFDVLVTTTCIPLTWHDDKTFPISGMNEVEIMGGGNYNLYVANTGGIFGNVSACAAEYCAPNKAPIVMTNPVKVVEDSLINACFSIQDDNNLDTHTATLCGAPKNGDVVFKVDNVTKELCFTYKPNKDFDGKDSVCINVCDNATPALCTKVTIPITVEPRPDAPSVILYPIATGTDEPITRCFDIKDADINDMFKGGMCGTMHGSASVKIEGNQVCLTYKSNKNYAGQDTVCVTVCDSYNLCTELKIPISVSECADINKPVLKCPSILEVTTYGEIVSNNFGFITKATVSDNCKGVILNFDLPNAKGDCSILPSVSQVSGQSTGSIFNTGTSILRFEAKTVNGLTSQCETVVRVVTPSLISPDIDSVIICTGQDFTLNGRRSEKAQYRWVGSNGFNSPTQSIRFIRATAPYTGMYHYIMNTENCEFTDSGYVRVLDKPKAIGDVLKIPKGTLGSANVVKNDTIVDKAAVKVKIKSGVTNGSLNFSPDGSFSYIPTATFAGKESFVYEICYVDCPNSCDLGTVNIDVLSGRRDVDVATNIITPNGDGVNDNLVIEGFDENSANNQSEMTVYNQWGNVVFQAKPYKNDWSGTFKDVALPDGTYYYIFLKDPTASPMKSFVTIIR